VLFVLKFDVNFEKRKSLPKKSKRIYKGKKIEHIYIHVVFVTNLF